MNEMRKGIKRLFGGDKRDEQVVVHGVLCLIRFLCLTKLGRGHLTHFNE